MAVLINKNFNGKIAIISELVVKNFTENALICHETEMGWAYTPAQEYYRELFESAEKVAPTDPILAPYRAHIFHPAKMGDPDGYIYLS